MSGSEEENEAMAVVLAIDEVSCGMKSQHVLTGIAMTLADYLHQSGLPVETLMLNMHRAIVSHLTELSNSRAIAADQEGDRDG